MSPVTSVVSKSYGSPYNVQPANSKFELVVDAFVGAVGSVKNSPYFFVCEDTAVPPLELNVAV